MHTEHAPAGAARWATVGLVIVLAFFCLPLFVGLDQEDLRNDEAIYSYSVDRIVETGEWLTPRAIPFDGPFLEKPPLKVWMVAALIESGLVPNDERGLRGLDALFGVCAFLYVYLLGRRLADPLCGAGAVLLLFLFTPLLFDHGLRSNNMEAALLLAYCGGLYHFARWAEAPPGGGRRGHAFAVAGFLVLGFMTKFVAIAFLPLIMLLSLAWRREQRFTAALAWREWVLPALLFVAACAPWFVYATLVHGRLVWDVMLGAHVYTRFTGALDPTHLHPWHYYVTQVAEELRRSRVHWFAAAGALFLLVRAWQGRPWLARVLAIWLVVPVAAISLGTSKLLHYAYPFLPPLALGAGLVVSALVAQLSTAAVRRRAALVTGRLGALPPPLARLASGLGAAALLVAFWTVMDGRVAVAVGGAHFTSASITRGIILGAVLLWLGAAPPATRHAWLIVPLIVWQASPFYVREVERLRFAEHPLRTLRDCAVDVQARSAEVGRAVYNAARAHTPHPYYYYLRRLGPVTFADAPDPAVVRQSLDGAHPSPIVVFRDDFGPVLTAITEAAPPPADTTMRDTTMRDTAMRDTASTALAARAPDALEPVVSGVINNDNVIVVLPGPYQACIDEAVSAGWRAVGEAPTAEP